MSDLNQYAKWFSLYGHNFWLNHVDGAWQVTAWSKDTSADVEPIHGDKKNDPSDALHDCYVKMRNLGFGSQVGN